MKNLILTCGTNYSQSVYDRFIGTLFDSGFNGDLVMFINKSDVDKVVKYKSIYNFDFKIIQNTHPYHIQTSRYVSYYDYLTDIDRSIYNLIFICDTRDVLFQKDIFSVDLGDYNLYGFQEDKIIGDCPINSHWIKSIFDSSVFEKLKENPIICSGTILGKTDSILLYLKTFIDILPSLRNIKEVGIDQAIHNYILYLRSDITKIKILTNEDNIVNTVGYGFKGINEENKVVNKNGDISFCVHQYDRFPKDLLLKVNQPSKYNFVI